MITLRRSQDRGFADHGWLKSYHTFSFADYHDRNYMGFRTLRVINEDRIEGGKGFGTHPHQDMEIITYVMSGALEHKDSMGNTTVILPGEVQRMSAGTGVTHSEFNRLLNEETHLYQIWIRPDQKGIKPGYGQRSYDENLKGGKLVLVASKDGREASIPIHQDASLYVARPSRGQNIEFFPAANRGQWVQVTRGQITLNDMPLSAGDGAAVEKEVTLQISAQSDSEFLLFDLA